MSVNNGHLNDTGMQQKGPQGLRQCCRSVDMLLPLCMQCGVEDRLTFPATLDNC
jgi:hypothetical protein